MRYLVFGNIGSDAGYWSYENGHWVHHGGWAVESIAEVANALNMISEAPQFKTPGLADAASKGLIEFVNRELGAHIKEGGHEGVVVIINTSAR